jgi:hypothetical protein
MKRIRASSVVMFAHPASGTTDDDARGVVELRDVDNFLDARTRKAKLRCRTAWAPAEKSTAQSAATKIACSFSVLTM